MRAEIERRVGEAGVDNSMQLESNDTLCRQVSNREPQLREFAAAHDVILFVAGKKSSNGWVLYNVCKEVNPEAYFVSSWDEVNLDWFDAESRIGICGATSTPMWLMEEIAGKLKATDFQSATN
jgi:4-hydroxy-3-methylbut-2-enyl diphosphate reductase